MADEPNSTVYPVCSDLSKVPSLLKEYGVCVIPDVFTDSECNTWMNSIISDMETLSGKKVNHKKPDSWTEENLPPVVRYGLYQNILNNLKTVWEIRRDPRMKDIFSRVYSEFRGENVDDFVCSLDGINIQPNIRRDTSRDKDWPHCDQTLRDDIFKCVQGQVVLTNTHASFRASPTSHKYFVDIMELAGIADSKRNWAKFNDHQLDAINENIITPNNVPFQVPIRSSKGSVILWLSTTIHSAMSSGVKETPTPDDLFKGWRGVVYVCYRPRVEFTFGELKVLEQCLASNRGTNHWATKVFTLPTRGNNSNFSPAIQRLIEDPKLVYRELRFKPDLLSCLINEPVDMTSYSDGVTSQENEDGGCSSSNKSDSSEGKTKSKGRVQGGWRPNSEM